MITATNLGEKYNNKIVLEDLYFTIQTGKVTVFLVPNGAGKSTIMCLMLGLDSGDGLTIFDGRVLSKYDKPSKTFGIPLEAKAFWPTRIAR